MRAAKVGANPGMTKTSQEIHLDKRVKLLDSPGIVFPKPGEVSDDIVLRNVVKLEQVADPISPVEKILERVRKEVILAIYKIPTFNTSFEFLTHVARKHGKLSKGGIPNVQAAARIVLQDWTGGKIPFYTEPPKVAAGIHIGAKIVEQFAPDFDVRQAQVLASLDTYHNSTAEIHGAPMASSAPMTIEDGYLNPPKEQDASSENISEDQVDYEDEDDDDLEMLPRPTHAETSTKPTKEVIKTRKQDLSDEADQFNPQINKNKKKQLKQVQKQKLKATKKKTNTPMADVGETEDYSFATDFNAEQDIDVDDIDAE